MSDQYPWKPIFLQIATRAMQRVHHDYTLWSCQQCWKTTPRLDLLSQGYGIELADEVTVCAAITQEFLHSRYPSGTHFEGNTAIGTETGLRHFRIYREYPYNREHHDTTAAEADVDPVHEHEDEELVEDPDSKSKPDETQSNTEQTPRSVADIAIERVDPSTGERVDNVVLIEAKRARLFTTKLVNPPKQAKGNQISEIRDDIKVLRATHSWPSKPLTYLLIWGVAGEGPYNKSVGAMPGRILKSIKDDALDEPLLSWVPLAWSHDDLKDTTKFVPITVRRQLWIALIEVKAIGEGR